MPTCATCGKSLDASGPGIFSPQGAWCGPACQAGKAQKAEPKKKAPAKKAAPSKPKKGKKK